MFCHPAGDAFPNLHAQVSQIRGVRQLRGPQYEFSGIGLHQIYQAGVAARHLRCKSHDFTQHFVQRKLRADDSADTVQHGRVVF